MSLENKIINELKSHGADFVHFVNISHLSSDQNRGFSTAILLGVALSPGYIQQITDHPDYVKHRIDNNIGFDDDEFLLTEQKTDQLSDHISQYLTDRGYNAYSQSERNQIATTTFDSTYIETLLPHKTIAVLAGLGWIGKNNLLVTTKYGSALCLGTILTNAPLNSGLYKPAVSKCGNCNVCNRICQTNALCGKVWDKGDCREDMIDVYSCTTCIKCLVFCPWTQAYIKKNKI